jgi:hypothetical protein
MAEHTQGPWRVGPTQQEPHGIQSVLILAGEDAVRFGVAKVAIIDFRDAEQATANANLIAAAPDLLEALHDLLARPTDGAARERARAAVAKATEVEGV